MYTSRSFRTASVLLLLAGCTTKKDLGNLPDGGAGTGSGGRGGQAGGMSGTGGAGTGGIAGSAAGGGGAGGGAGGSAGGMSGTGGTSGVTGSGGTAGASGTGGTSGVTGTGGTSGASGTAGTSGVAGTGGTSGTAGTAGASGVAGRGGTVGTAGTSGVGGTGGGAAGSTGTGGGSACIGASNQTGRGPALMTVVGGTFTFGAANLSPPNPPRTLAMDTFRMDQTLVTAAQFRDCVQAGCCTLAACDGGQTNYSATPAAHDTFPMNCVNLAEATAFCTWAGKEIPSEEQWEYAARGPDPTRTYPWGNLPPLMNASGLVDPSPVCTGRETPTPGRATGCPVGAHSPQGDTPDGIGDMAGSVRQWTTNCDSVNCVVKSDTFGSTSWIGTNRNTTGIQSHIQWLGFRCVRSGGSGTGGSTGTGGTGGTETHTITEFTVPTASSQISQIAAGPDGNIWFTESGGNNIGRITPAGTITEFPLPVANSFPSGIVAGSDGNVWFTGYLTNLVGFITPAGVMTASAPPTVYRPNYIAKGPALDSAMWYVGPTQVGRVAVNGSIIGLYGQQTVTNGTGPIVAGPDNNLWLAGGTGVDSDIFRLNPMQSTWTVTDFTIAGALGINGVTVGPDHNIWFTTTSDRIGRITTSGALTRFPLPNPGAAPYGITTGPDGNLWFTENKGNQIGRITPTGTVTEFPVPTANAGARGITAGPDGNLWFAEYAANKIGRITP